MNTRSLIPFVLIAGTILIGIFYLRPTWDEFQQLRQETKRLQELSGEFDELEQQRDALFAKLTAVPKENLIRAEQIIPKGEHLLDYLISLESATRQRGIALNSVTISTPSDGRQTSAKPIQRPPAEEPLPRVSPKPAPDTTGSVASSQVPRSLDILADVKPLAVLNDLEVGAGISGEYGPIKDFLSDMESHLRLTDIQTLNFSSPNKSEQNERLVFSVTVKFKTYFQ
ncbi:MAG: hypothetical protein HY006_02590 [Candidatus Sungbacteria bacterium]|nr:hypothetical protein [Candidatus Sungbacteria bacterium]